MASLMQQTFFWVQCNFLVDRAQVQPLKKRKGKEKRIDEKMLVCLVRHDGIMAANIRQRMTLQHTYKYRWAPCSHNYAGHVFEGNYFKHIKNVSNTSVSIFSPGSVMVLFNRCPNLYTRFDTRCMSALQNNFPPKI